MKFEGIGLVRGISAVFIVGCHLALLPNTQGAEYILHFCNMFVGVFGAISGFLLANSLIRQQNGLLQLFHRKVLRLLVPYAFWTVIYVTASHFLGANAHATERFSVVSLVNIIFRGGGACHLWYLSTIFYLSLVIISLWVCVHRFLRNLCAKSELLSWSVMLLGGLLILASTFYRNHFSLYELRLSGFVTLGFGMRLVLPSFMHIRCFLLILLFALAVILHLFFVPLHNFIKDAIVVMPLLLFAVIYGVQGGKVGKVMDQCSFGVYLVHPLVTAAAALFVRKWFATPYTAWITFVDWVLCYLLALCVTFVIKAIPVLRKFV